MASSFKEFAPFFHAELGGVPLYLLLLNPSESTKIAVRSLRSAIEASGEHFSIRMAQLLTEANWRPQLVAASAMLMTKRSSDVELLWNALDFPCWTSPQLAAAASRLDPDFAAKAKTRIDSRCPIRPHDSPMNALARHSALGPASLISHSSKLLSALIALCAADYPFEPWVVDLSNNKEIQEDLMNDADHGDKIALSWRSSMEALLTQA